MLNNKYIIQFNIKIIFKLKYVDKIILLQKNFDIH